MSSIEDNVTIQEGCDRVCKLDDVDWSDASVPKARSLTSSSQTLSMTSTGRRQLQGVRLAGRDDVNPIIESNCS